MEVLITLVIKRERGGILLQNGRVCLVARSFKMGKLCSGANGSGVYSAPCLL